MVAFHYHIDKKRLTISCKNLCVSAIADVGSAAATWNHWVAPGHDRDLARDSIPLYHHKLPLGDGRSAPP
jgi:hypothetical protein